MHNIIKTLKNLILLNCPFRIIPKIFMNYSLICSTLSIVNKNPFIGNFYYKLPNNEEINDIQELLKILLKNKYVYMLNVLRDYSVIIYKNKKYGKYKLKKINLDLMDCKTLRIYIHLQDFSDFYKYLKYYMELNNLNKFMKHRRERFYFEIDFSTDYFIKVIKCQRIYLEPKENSEENIEYILNYIKYLSSIKMISQI